MSDMEGMGYLGRRQFKDMLGILKLEVDDDMLFQMFNDMDADGNGQIEFNGQCAGIGRLGGQRIQ